MTSLIDPVATETHDLSAFRELLCDVREAETPRFSPLSPLDVEDDAVIEGLVEEFLGQLEETWA